jgi:hypothetical protein
LNLPEVWQPAALSLRIVLPFRAPIDLYKGLNPTTRRAGIANAGAGAKRAAKPSPRSIPLKNSRLSSKFINFDESLVTVSQSGAVKKSARLSPRCRPPRGGGDRARAASSAR